MSEYVKSLDTTYKLRPLLMPNAYQHLIASLKQTFKSLIAWSLSDLIHKKI